MFVEAGGQAPPWLSELQGFFRGHKRKDAEERQKANRKMTEGMDPMPFALYKWLGKYFLEHGDHVVVLPHSWNLCCRTGNTRVIRLEHLAWDIDALTVYFAITKTDQGGTSLACLLNAQLSFSSFSTHNAFLLYCVCVCAIRGRSSQASSCLRQSNVT